MRVDANTADVARFEGPEQRRQANQLGMWTLLSTEVLFFGGMILAYVVYRWAYPAQFAAGSRTLNFWAGTINTAVLLTSSLTMALADKFAESGRKQAFLAFVSLTAVLGVAFVCVKGYEYHEMWAKGLFPGPGFDPSRPPQLEMFVYLYFTMTAVHALHMLVGIGLMAWLLRLSLLGKVTKASHEAVSMVGLYWHFVDCVWVVLYPLLYLVPNR